MNNEMTIIVTIVWTLAVLLQLAKKPLFEQPENDKGMPISWLKIPVGDSIICRILQMTFSHVGTFREHGFHMPDRSEDTDLAVLVELRSEITPGIEGGVRGLQFMVLQGALTVDLLRLCFLENWTLGGDDGSDTYAVPEGVEIRVDHQAGSGARTRYLAVIEKGGSD